MYTNGTGRLYKYFSVMRSIGIETIPPSDRHGFKPVPIRRGAVSGSSSRHRDHGRGDEGLVWADTV